MFNLGSVLEPAMFGTFFHLDDEINDGSMSLESHGYRNFQLLCFILDALQTIRCIITPSFGWSYTTAIAVRWTDPVYVLHNLVNLLFGRWFWYTLSMAYTFVFLLTLAYAGERALKGDIHRRKIYIIPIFMKRYVLESFFISFVGYLMMPFECSFSYIEIPFSAYLRTTDVTCTPFSYAADAFISFLSILMIVPIQAFMYYSTQLCCSWYPFDENPKAQGGIHCETVRWIMRLLILFLPFVSQYITSIASASVLAICCWAILRKHQERLPFHRMEFNLMRGGCIAAFFYCAFAGLAMGFLKMLNGQAPTAASSQLLEWVLVGFIPISAVVGAYFTQIARLSIFHNINRLRTDFVKEQQLMDMARGGDKESQGGGSTTGSQVSITNAIPKTRTPYERFYKSLPTGSNAFHSALHALVNIRQLTFEREEKDIPFLEYLIGRALKEFPASVDLQMLQVVHLIFILDSQANAHVIIKALKMGRYLDQPMFYAVFVLERKEMAGALGAGGGEGVGGGHMNAMSIAEFNTGMERVRKYHLSTITKVKQFWGVVSKKSTDRNHVKKHIVDQLLGYIDNFDKQRHKAKIDYTNLVHRYPSSVALLRQYASFCDVVLNNVLQAEKLRKIANQLEASPSDNKSDKVDDDMQEELEKAAGTSMGSDQSGEGGRIVSSRFFQNNRGLVLAAELRSVQMMDLVVKQAIIILIILGVTTFCITDLVLFQDTAMKNLRLIDGTGLFSVHTVKSMYYIREQIVAAALGDMDMIKTLRATIQNSARLLQQQHWLNYQDISRNLDEFYHVTQIPHVQPVDSKWKSFNFSFWYLGNDFVSRLDMASSSTLLEFQDSAYSLDQISPEKRCIPYIFENSFRVLIPSFNDVLGLYQLQLVTFGTFVNLIVFIACAVNSVVITFKVVTVFRSINSCLHSLHHPFIVSCLALYLSRNTAKKIHKYYSKQEQSMIIMDDDEDDQQNIEALFDLPSDAFDNPDQGEGAIDAALIAPEPGTLTEFSEDNIQKYIQYQMTIINLPGRYGTCTEWDFILDGDKPKKAGGAGDDDDDDSGSFAVAHPDASPDDHHDKDQNHDAHVEKEGGGGAGGAPAEDDLYADLDNHESPPIRVASPNRSPLRSAVAHASTPASRPSVKGLLRSRNHPKSSKKLAWADEVSGVAANLLSPAHKHGTIAGVSPALAAAPGRSAPMPSFFENEDQELDNFDDVDGDDDDERERFSDLDSNDDDDHMPVTIQDLSVSHSLAQKMKENSGSDFERLPSEETDVSAECQPTGAWSKVLEGGRISPVMGFFNSARTPTDDGEEHPLVSPPRGIQTEIPPKPSFQRRKMLAPPPGDDDSDPFALSNELQEHGHGHADEAVLQEQVEGVLRMIKERDTPKLVNMAAKPAGGVPERLASASSSKGWTEEDSSWGSPPGAQRKVSLNETSVSGELVWGGQNGYSTPIFNELSAGVTLPGSPMLKKRDGKQHRLLEKSPEPQKMVGAGPESQQQMPPTTPVAPLDQKKPSSAVDTVAKSKSDQDKAGQEQQESADRMSKEEKDNMERLKLIKEAKARRDNEVHPVTMATKAEFGTSVRSRQSIFLNIPVYVVVFAALFGMCMSSILYPARLEGSISNLAPLIRQSDRRLFLTLAVTHLSRELALNDGLSRLSQDELASALRMHIDQLVLTDRAIRLGNALDIESGGDILSAKHNSLMYDNTCAWRASSKPAEGMVVKLDPNNCDVPYRSGLGGKGLFVIMVEFMQTAENVLQRYAPPQWTYSDSFRSPATPESIYKYTQVPYNASKWASIQQQDTDIMFLVSQFDGDLFQGLTVLQGIFVNMKENIMVQLHSDNRVFFSSYMCTIIIIFYLIIFRSTVKKSIDETKRVRKFIDMMPTHILTKDECADIIKYFKSPDLEGEGSIHSHDDDEHLAPGHNPKLVKIYDISVHHLPRMDWFWGSKCDPFVLFDFDDKKSKTEVIKNTFDAKFPDEIFFDVENVDEAGDMSILVKDWDFGSSDEAVGSAMLPKPDIRDFLSLPIGSHMTYTLDLFKKDRRVKGKDGEITSISFSIKMYPSKRAHETGDGTKLDYDENGSVTSADIALGDNDVERTGSMEAEDSAVEQQILRARLSSMDRLSSAESASRLGSGEGLLRRTGSGKLLPAAKLGPLGNISFSETTPEHRAKQTDVPVVGPM